MSKKKFPSPNNSKRGEEVVMITAKEALDLHNQYFPEDPKQRMGSTVKTRLDHVSQNHGWAGTAHIKNAKTGHAAGLLLVAPNQNVNVNVLIFPRVNQSAGKKLKLSEKDVTDV